MISQTALLETKNRENNTACIALDESDKQLFSSQMRVNSTYQVSGDRVFYDYGGAQRSSLDALQDVQITPRTMEQARYFKVDLKKPEDVMGTYFYSSLDSAGKAPSVEEIQRLTKRRWRRVISLDDAPNLWYHRELQRSLMNMTEIEKGEAATARSVFPIEDFNQVGLSSISWSQIQTDSPEAEWIDPGEDRPAPTVKMERTEASRKIVGLHHGYNVNWFTLQQMALAKMNGAPDLRIEERMIEEARLQCLRLENRAIMFGNQTMGLLGLLSQNEGVITPIDVDPNNPLNNAQGVAQVGPSVANKWLSEVFPGAEGTPEEMFDILTKPFTQMYEETDFADQPDAIGIGYSDFVNINRKLFYGNGVKSSETVAEVVLRSMKRLGLKAIVALPELAYSPVREQRLLNKKLQMGADNPYMIGETFASAYAGGLFKRNTMVCFKRDAKAAAILVGKNLMVRPALDLNDNKQTKMYLWSGGLLVRRPRSLRIVVAPSGA